MSLLIQKILKRAFDFTMALICLIIIAPLFVIVALLIKWDSPGPVFYVQERVGKDGKTFKMFKFRTMMVGAQNMGLGLEVAQDDPRITRMGRALRQWTLDELPQIINVLKGDMSIVGPRPALPHQVARYTSHQRHRLQMKPGMANLPFINGRNTLPWAQRIELDIWHVDNWSLRLDFYILLKSFFAALRREGVYGADGVVRDLE